MSAAARPDFSDGAPQSLPPLTFDGLLWRSAAFSASGARPYNEDRLGHASTGQAAFWTLADGLGGHRGGSRAAELAVETSLAAVLAADGVELEPRLRRAVNEADARVRAGQVEEADFPEMRSTLVLLGADGRRLAWAHVGDSRLYHFRQGRLQWRTRDHSAAQLLAAAGELDDEAIASYPGRSRLVSCLGGANELLVSVRAATEPAAGGDALLICSDGMWEHFSNGELESLVAATSGPEALLAAMALRVTAAAYPDQDNYSAIALFAA